MEDFNLISIFLTLSARDGDNFRLEDNKNLRELLMDNSQLQISN